MVLVTESFFSKLQSLKNSQTHVFLGIFCNILEHPLCRIPVNTSFCNDLLDILQYLYTVTFTPSPEVF